MRQPLQLGWHAAYFMLFIMWFSIDMIKLGYTWNARWHFNTSHLTKAYIKNEIHICSVQVALYCIFKT